MFTIAMLTRCSGLPRRTIQFWADKEILVPIDVLDATTRRHYSRTEMEIVRLLRPFYNMGTPIDVLTMLAVVFRDCLLGDLRSGTEEHETFGPLVDAARQGKPAHLGVQINLDSSGASSNGYTMTMYPAASAKDVAALAKHELELEPRAPIVLINLTEALDENAIKRQLAAVRELDNPTT